MSKSQRNIYIVDGMEFGNYQKARSYAFKVCKRTQGDVHIWCTDDKNDRYYVYDTVWNIPTKYSVQAVEYGGRGAIIDDGFVFGKKDGKDIVEFVSRVCNIAKHHATAPAITINGLEYNYKPLEQRYVAYCCERDFNFTEYGKTLKEVFRKAKAGFGGNGQGKVIDIREWNYDFDIDEFEGKKYCHTIGYVPLKLYFKPNGRWIEDEMPH